MPPMISARRDGHDKGRTVQGYPARGLLATDRGHDALGIRDRPRVEHDLADTHLPRRIDVTLAALVVETDRQREPRRLALVPRDLSDEQLGGSVRRGIVRDLQHR